MKCLDFYVKNTKQILLRLPLKNSVIEKFKFLDPMCVKSKGKNTVSDVAALFPNLVFPEKLQDLDNEWRLLKNYPVDDIESDMMEGNCPCKDRGFVKIP